MPKVTEAIQNFLRARRSVHNGPDLLDRWTPFMETQVNVAQGDGEPVAEKRNTYTDGINEWFNIRIPKNAATTPDFRDYELRWPLDRHVEGIGWTGWDWQASQSRAAGFDFDSIAGHAKGVGISDDELARVKAEAIALPYVEVRKSTGGGGLHLYVYFDGVPTANHTEHARLARAVLGMMGRDTGFDFASHVDACGGNMWIWHRKMSAENGGLSLVKPAERTLSDCDLPANWRVQIRVTPKPAKLAADPTKDDFCQSTDWRFLEEHGWRIDGDHLTRPGKSDGVSASFVEAEDGTPLLHVFTSSAPPFEKGKSYNALDAYAMLKHAGDKKAARADLLKQGFGRLEIPLITSAELDGGKYETEYLIPGVLVARQPCIVAGPKKALKTSLLIDLAVSLATGKPFLRCLPVARECKVIVMSGESGLSTIQETARRIAKSMGVALADIGNLHWSTFLPTFDDARHLDALERMIQETGCEVLIVDPAYLCMPGTDAANLFVQGALLRRVSEICQEHGVGLVLAHHTRKRGKSKNQSDYEAPELDDMAWAGFAEFARQWLLIGRREEFEPGSGEHRLWLSVGGSAGHSALWAVDVNEGIAGKPREWEVSLSSADEARTAKKHGSIRQRLLDAAREFPSGQTKTAIFETAKLKSDLATRTVFDSLVSGGELAPRKVKKQGTTYDGFCLAS